MKLYQSYIGEYQRSCVAADALPLDAQANSGSDQREYELLKAIDARRDPADQEPWGLISWKFQHKTLVAPEAFLTFAQQQFAAGVDCVFINPMIGHEAIYLSVWEHRHKGMDRIQEFLQQRLGDGVLSPMGVGHFAFCNYFIANNRFWRAYFAFVDDVLAGLDEEVRRQSEVGLVYAGSAGYSRDAEVTMRPFIIERLFSSFLISTPGLAVAHFGVDPALFRRKFGDRLGDLLHRLSVLKNESLEREDRHQLEAWNRMRLAILKGQEKFMVWHMDDALALYTTPEYRAFMGEKFARGQRCSEAGREVASRDDSGAVAGSDV